MKNMLLYLSILANLGLMATGFLAVQKLGGWSYLWYKFNHRGLSANYGHRVDLFEHLALPPGEVVLLGNSLTQQGEWSELLGQQVYNRGISGDGTQGVLDRLSTITAAQPRQIWLSIGINDLITDSPGAILTRYQELVERIRRETPQTQLFLQSVLPINNEVRSTGFRAEDILALNEGLQRLADNYQLKLIDLHTIFKDTQGQLSANYTDDGIHLNGAGYLLWAKTIKPYLPTTD